MKKVKILCWLYFNKNFIFLQKVKKYKNVYYLCSRTGPENIARVMYGKTDSFLILTTYICSIFTHFSQFCAHLFYIGMILTNRSYVPVGRGFIFQTNMYMHLWCICVDLWSTWTWTDVTKRPYVRYLGTSTSSTYSGPLHRSTTCLHLKCM